MDEPPIDMAIPRLPRVVCGPRNVDGNAFRNGQEMKSLPGTLDNLR